jgi:ASC-1-like (ASCH) protein
LDILDDVWSTLDKDGFDKFIERGQVLKEIQLQYIQLAVKKASFSIAEDPLNPERAITDAHLNQPILQSDTGDYIVTTYPWVDVVAMFYVQSEKTIFSLRSGGYPVNKLLEKLGMGGGHPKAAGGAVDKIVGTLPLTYLDTRSIYSLMAAKPTWVSHPSVIACLKSKFVPELIHIGQCVSLDEASVQSIRDGTKKYHVSRASERWTELVEGNEIYINKADLLFTIKSIQRMPYTTFLTRSTLVAECFPNSTTVAEQMEKWWPIDSLISDGVIVFEIV